MQRIRFNADSPFHSENVASKVSVSECLVAVPTEAAHLLRPGQH